MVNYKNKAGSGKGSSRSSIPHGHGLWLWHSPPSPAETWTPQTGWWPGQTHWPLAGWSRCNLQTGAQTGDARRRRCWPLREVALSDPGVVITSPSPGTSRTPSLLSTCWGYSLELQTFRPAPLLQVYRRENWGPRQKGFHQITHIRWEAQWLQAQALNLDRSGANPDRLPGSGVNLGKWLNLSVLACGKSSRTIMAVFVTTGQGWYKWSLPGHSHNGEMTSPLSRQGHPRVRGRPQPRTGTLLLPAQDLAGVWPPNLLEAGCLYGSHDLREWPTVPVNDVFTSWSDSSLSETPGDPLCL